MKFDSVLLSLPLMALVTGCGKTSEIGLTAIARPNGATLPVVTGPNVLTLTVNGSICSANSYPNKPCTNVTVCVPGTSTCQTISDVLVDTGSSGLRVFKSVLGSVTLTNQTSGGQTVAECVQYGDGTSDWGPVANADIVLGRETASSVPIQVIDSTFMGANANCSGADVRPSSAGFNGILGVGLFQQDCGSDCALNTNNPNYFGCSGGTCTGHKQSLANQVSNPVTALSTDNNGVILELPSIALGGQQSLNGYLILGIGTQTNNSPASGLTTFSADSSAEFHSVYNGTNYSSFLDSGSNAYYFPAPSSIPDCGTTNVNFTGFLCPNTTLSLSATNVAASGSPSGDSDFQVGNAITLTDSGYGVFVEMAGTSGGSLGSVFDWGLPFYIGRNVYVGFENKSSTLGSGLYWAY